MAYDANVEIKDLPPHLVFVNRKVRWVINLGWYPVYPWDLNFRNTRCWDYSSRRGNTVANVPNQHLETLTITTLWCDTSILLGTILGKITNPGQHNILRGPRKLSSMGWPKPRNLFKVLPSLSERWAGKVFGMATFAFEHWYFHIMDFFNTVSVN